MSEQVNLQPRFVVIKDIRSAQLGVRDSRGFWRVCIEMQYPYDTYATALKVCDALNAVDLELPCELDPRQVPNVGLNVK